MPELIDYLFLALYIAFAIMVFSWAYMIAKPTVYHLHTAEVELVPSLEAVEINLI